jgi:FtsP/CotA-like multicopper oxidase with cupredoxin domain
MSRGSQVGLVVLAAVVVVLVFVLLRPGDEATVAPTGTSPTAPAPVDTAETKTKPAGAEATQIKVVGGEPQGGVTQIDAKQGDQVVFEVIADQPEEVHVHGYDLAEDVGPGQKAEFDFAADLEGIYEIELENSATPIGELRVTP